MWEDKHRIYLDLKKYEKGRLEDGGPPGENRPGSLSEKTPAERVAKKKKKGGDFSSEA